MIQNCLVSIAGVLEHNRRYGGTYSEFAKDLILRDRDRCWKDYQACLLEKTIDNALNNVPYYKKLGISRPNIHEFPVLERSSIALNPEKFTSSKYINKKLKVIYTGGSSGTPLAVYLSNTVRQKSYAFWSRFYGSFDYKIGQKRATFLGRKLQRMEDNTPPFWRYNILDKQLLFSTFHMTDKVLPSYVEKLNIFKPDMIEGYPYTVYKLATFILENSIKLNFIPKGISVSSENLSEKQKKTIEMAFSCKVYDQYGSAETVVFAGDCEYGNKHFAVEYGLVEILNSDGTISPDGEGELLVTGFLNDVMPLIRYRIGDIGRVSYRECPCGRNTPILEELSGKVGAVIVSGERAVSTAAIAFAFEYLEHIKRAQIVQNEPMKIHVKLVISEGYNGKEEDFMLWELKKMLGSDLEIVVNYVEDIPVGENGKYQMVVQNYY